MLAQIQRYTKIFELLLFMKKKFVELKGLIPNKRLIHLIQYPNNEKTLLYFKMPQTFVSLRKKEDIASFFILS